LLGRAALALEVAAGDAAGRVVFFGVVDRQRQEIDAFLGLLGRHDGGKHGGLAVSGEHGAVGLTRHSAGLEGELAPAPIEFNSMRIEHCLCLSQVSASPKAMSKTARGCACKQQRLAILLICSSSLALIRKRRSLSALAGSGGSAAGQISERLSRIRLGETRRAPSPRAQKISGGCRASRSNPCSCVRRCVEDNRATYGAGSPS